MDPVSLPWTIASLTSALAVAMWVERLVTRLHRRWTVRRRQVRAAAGERKAESVLRKAGYRIEARQAELDWAVDVDDEAIEVPLRADLLVRRGRRRYVAEVKTGRRAPSVRRSASTRRQLLEYRVAYDVDGVLLVDMEAGQIHEVAFPGVDDVAVSRRPAAIWMGRLVWLLLGLGLGAWMV